MAVPAPEKAGFFRGSASIHALFRWQVTPKLLDRGIMLHQSRKAQQSEFCFTEEFLGLSQPPRGPLGEQHDRRYLEAGSSRLGQARVGCHSEMIALLDTCIL
jgi:hypothetical protein